MIQFYTYIHCKPDGTPFYVGKGSGNRANDFFNGRNTRYKRLVSKYGRSNIKVFVFNCDSEEQAFSDEVSNINQLRSQFDLVNISGGGESGSSGVKRSDDTRRKMSEYQSNRTESHRQKMIAARRALPPMSEETKKKISESRKNKSLPNPMLGRKHSPESIAKMKANRKPKIKIRDSSGKFTKE